MYGSLELVKQLPSHLINISDLNDKALRILIRGAVGTTDIEIAPPGRVAGIAFFQPSTRTLLSFQSAAIRIGLPVIAITSIDGTRLGDFYNESPEDAILYMQQYCDLLIVRHFRELDQQFIAQLEVPLINAGDAYNSHPTQAIGDVAALIQALDTDVDKISVGILGATNLRTTRSFIQTLKRVSKAKVVVIADDEGQHSNNHEDDWVRVRSKDELIKVCDAVYISGANHADFTRARTAPRVGAQAPLLTESDLTSNRDILIMHPGPKTHDVHKSLDRMPNNLVWKQAQCATRVRQRLLSAYAHRALV